MRSTIRIWDLTLRDGEQTPGLAFSPQDKLDIAARLDAVGVHMADVSFPSSSAQECEATRMILDAGFRMGVNVTAMMRPEDVALAAELGAPEINMMAPLSDVHIDKKFGLDRATITRRIAGVFKSAAEAGIRVNFIGEDTSRADQAFARDVFQLAFDNGADKLVICDTVGVMEPARMGEMTHALLKGVDPAAVFAIHCHNDYGLATANTLAALDAGVHIATVTVNGIGERAGNASLEQVVLALEKLHKVDTGIDMRGLYDLSRLVEERSGMPIGITQPVVGGNAFTHESGIHVAAMLKDTTTYEALSPEYVGCKHRFVLGKHSGKNNVRRQLELLGMGFDERQLEEITREIKNLFAEGTGKTYLRDGNGIQKAARFGLSQEKFSEIAQRIISGS